jgi:hypothetical protein
MFPKMLKVLVVGAMAVSGLASASSASAWTTNGAGVGSAFTATTGATRMTATPGLALNCSGPNDAVGVLYAKSGAPSGLRLLALQMRFAGCAFAGLPITVTCTPLASVSPQPAAFNGVSYVAPVSTGSLSNIRCVISISTCVITVTGAVSATYNNTTFQLTVPSSGQALSYAAPSVCSWLGFAAVGGADYTNSLGGNVVYTVISAFKPNITNP